MTWIWVALVIILLGVTAAVAVGRFGAMAPAYPDRPDVRLPADRPLTAEDLEDVEFSVVMRGYRMDEVDEVVRRLVQELAERDAKLADLERPKHRAGAEDAGLSAAEVVSRYERGPYDAEAYERMYQPAPESRGSEGPGQG